MKEYKVLISEIAENDINNILNYILYELRNKSSAINLNKKLKEAILSLSKMPERHKKVNDVYLAKKGLRTIIVDNYIIFYYVTEEDLTVNIIRVLYNRRNWSSLL